jgi:hypothetical protein
MAKNQLPFPVNEVSKDPAVADLVGQEFEWKGLRLLLVKTAATLTSPAGKFALFSDRRQSTISGNAAAGAYPGTVAGLVPAKVDGNVTSNAYIFVIRGGKEKGDNKVSVAIFSSAQVGAGGLPVRALDDGVAGVHQISSTVQQGLGLAVLDQIASSDQWLSSPGTFSARVQVTLSC